MPVRSDRSCREDAAAFVKLAFAKLAPDESLSETNPLQTRRARLAQWISDVTAPAANQHGHTCGTKRPSTRRSSVRRPASRRPGARRLQNETLETRQLLAGPELVGIQTNQGDLLLDGTVLSVSPRELVFRFDDDTRLDPSTLDAIRVTRAGEDGAFESANARSSLGLSNGVLLEFRARQTGSLGNGVQIVFDNVNRGNTAAPLINVDGNVINVSLNNRPGFETQITDLVAAFNPNSGSADPVASRLVEVIPVTGRADSELGGVVADGRAVTLRGAGAAQRTTDFGVPIGGIDALNVRFVSNLAGEEGLATRIEFVNQNFGSGARPVVITTDQTIQVRLNSTPGFETTVAEVVEAINADPDASALVTAVIQSGPVGTVLGGRSLQPITLSGVSDVSVTPGFVGLGDSTNEVVFRFAEALPDDLYQIDILGSGTQALLTSGGMSFDDGMGLSTTFAIDLGPKVVAVVPEPIRRTGNQVTQARGQIDVYFNERLDRGSAQNVNFYQLIFGNDPSDPSDAEIDAVGGGGSARQFTPQSVSYNISTNVATLQFAQPLALLDSGVARLRIGSAEALPAAPTQVNLTNPTTGRAVEAGETIGSAASLDDPNTIATPWIIRPTGKSSAIIEAEIQNVTPFDFQLPGPDVAGVRETRAEDPTRNDGLVPLDYVRRGPDAVDGISTITYDFAGTYRGFNSNVNTPGNNLVFTNTISEIQQQRVREAFELFSQYLGISFIELQSDQSEADFTIAVGDLAGAGGVSGAGGQVVVLGNRDGDLLGPQNLAVLDFQDFDESIDDQFGGEFSRGALFAVGQLLGYGYADDLPQPVTQSTTFVLNPGDDNEPLYPAPADIVNGQFLYRPDSTDVDLYRFTIPANTSGVLQAETIAQRLTDTSLLDTTLRLYRQVGGDFIEVATNDDYFSNDSLITLEVEAGDYVLGVSASGNETYNPDVRESGFGGTTQGEYRLRLEFTPVIGTTITDAAIDSNNDGDTTDPGDFAATPLDGDNDNRPGGVFNFWFAPSETNNTLYVDKLGVNTGGPLGTLQNPYTEIDNALAAAGPGDTVLVLGNGGNDGRIETIADNAAYNIGTAQNQLPLPDGTSLEVPRGVRLVIDSGAILKFGRAGIGVGSDLPTIDRSDSSLQVLGRPSIIGAGGQLLRDADGDIIPGSVYFTSINDRSIGNGGPAVGSSTPTPGDWGGIDFRGAIDEGDLNRRFRENEGVFVNHVQFADIRFGGGVVNTSGRGEVISPIEMDVTRPTILNSVITDSADAAISATPRTFEETLFTTDEFQGESPFTLDYRRVGPQIAGNRLVDNSINGLFIDVETTSGGGTEAFVGTARFDDTDIVHVLTENLTLAGGVGGPVLVSDSPSVILVRTLALPNAVGGNVPAGSYSYRLTNVDDRGNDSPASVATVPVALGATGAIRLSNLPALRAGDGFTSRRLYRAAVDAAGNPTGPFRLVATLNGSRTSFTDEAATGTTILDAGQEVRVARLDSTLVVDPATVVKLDGARIEARFGANLIMDGLPSLPVVITSLEDTRYGAGGTFDTNDRGGVGGIEPGQWSGIFLGQGASASIDNAVIAGAGGESLIAGGAVSFNAIEVQQSELRLANSRLELNANGINTVGANIGDLSNRVGRGQNDRATVFVRGSQPIIVNNTFVDNNAPAISADINSFTADEVTDPGRQSGPLDAATDVGRLAIDTIGNAGPLVRDNVLDGNSVNGMVVRGGVLATAGVLDDIDMTHVVLDTIEVPNRFVNGGLRIQSDARGSLVVKFENTGGEVAGIVTGGRLLSAEEDLGDIADRIGGALQVVGFSDFPVVLTALADDSAGSGFDLQGRPQVDTNGDGLGESRGLPTGPEVNQGLLIDNDVDPSIPGFFAFTPTLGGTLASIPEALATSAGLTQNFENQFPLFEYANFIDVGADGDAVNAETITETMAPMLVGDDLVVSEGTIDGANGLITVRTEQTFEDGSPTLTTVTTLTSDTPLGNLRFINYYDPVLGQDAGDILFTEGNPGEENFRLTILDGPEEIGFRQYGSFVAGEGLVNAQYEGWIADDFPDLITDPEFDLEFTPEGTIDFTSIPVLNDPRFPTPNYGPGILTSALAWTVDPNATTATITTNLELIAETFVGAGLQAEPGDWNGLIVREASNDRNVAAVVEQEANRVAVDAGNDVATQAQFLGELAPSETDGDENRRLGFIIDGAISTRRDVDVYSFTAEAGTEVFFDIDKTNNSLDTIVELIDLNGRVLAGSNDSVLADPSGASPIGTPGSLYYDPSVIDDNSVLPLQVLQRTEPVQEFTIDAGIDQLIGTLGNVTVQVDGTPGVAPTETIANFVADPSGTLESILETNFGDLGDVEVSSIRNRGGDLIVRVRFDDDRFEFSDAPGINLTVTGLAGGVQRRIASARDQVQDTFSINAKDAGFRMLLPGQAGQRNTYTIRVRSADLDTPRTTTTVADVASQVIQETYRGRSVGNYQLQIRLQEADETAGTVIRQSDVRFAGTGIQVIGGPISSALTGEEYEVTTDNGTIQTAQPIGYGAAGQDAGSPFDPGEDEDDPADDIAAVPGVTANPLISDRLAKSVSGLIDDSDDVDFYQFEIDFDYLEGLPIDDYFSAVFDLDYVSGFGRSDLAFYVFDSAGSLILTGDDSNVAGDRPGRGNAGNLDLLGGGSLGAADPFIGPIELDGDRDDTDGVNTGIYYVAVSNATQVPVQLDQFFNADSANPLLRLEPMRSVRRIVEDRILEDILPFPENEYVEQQLLFDPNNAVVPFALDDVVLYVNTPGSLQLVNPFTGQNYGRAGNFGDGITEVAFNNEGELFGYANFSQRPINDENLFYYQISPEDATLTGPLSQGAGLTTFTAVPNQNPPPAFNVIEADVGTRVEAVSIAAVNSIQRGFFVGNRGVGFNAAAEAAGADYDTNILYRFAPETGLVNTANVAFTDGLSGAATSPREIGEIDTDIRDVNGTGIFFTTLGLTAQTRLTGEGTVAPQLIAGDSFVIADIPDEDTGNRNQVRFEFTTAPVLTATGTGLVADGSGFTFNNGGITIPFEFNTGRQITLAASAPVGNGSTDLIQSGSRVTVGGVTFQFARTGEVVADGNIAILIEDSALQPISAAALANTLAAAINDELPGVRAASSGGNVFFIGASEPALSIGTGGGANDDGLQLTGNTGVAAGVQEIRVDETISPQGLITVLARRLTDNGVDVDVSGQQLGLPDGSSVNISPGPTGVTPPLNFSGGSGNVAAGSTPIRIEPSDTTQTIAERVAAAINASNVLDDVTATPSASSRSILISGGSVVQANSASGALTQGGARRGGQVTGIDVVAGGDLYAVTDRGELYRVPQGTLGSFGARNVGQLVDTATDLVGIPFEGLSVGPNSFGDGELREILFGITGSGTIYAFNLAGELQPIFAGGATSVETNIAGAAGLDFSTLAQNLWHVTGVRGNDPGHGANATFNASRGSDAGGSSLAFNYEESVFGSTYSPGESPGTEFNQTYNFPGGAKGAIESTDFSLAGYVDADQPHLYFNYYLETDRNDGLDGQTDADGDGRGDGDTDSLRVFVIAADGTQHLLATNNTLTGPDSNDDEFDDPPPVAPYDDNIDVDVQPLFDGTNNWRQARIDLGDFAGQSGLRLRVEFATSGQATGSTSLRTVAASELSEGDRVTIADVDFQIDFAPTLVAPSGAELAAAFDDGADRAITIGDTRYILSDGTGTVDAVAGEVPIDLAISRDNLLALSSIDVANIIADVLRDPATAPASVLNPDVALDLTVNVVNNLVELVTDEEITVTVAASSPVDVTGVQTLIGTPIRLSRAQSAEAVAAVVQQTVADTLLAGNTTLVPLTNTSVRLAGLPLNDAGPFANEDLRYADQFGGGVLAGARDNNFEGAYLDDFIIGFAERGEIATGSNAVTDQTFIADQRFAFPEPDEPAGGPDTAAYTFEIRDASEYVIPNSAAFDDRFRAFDTNAQLSAGLSITLPDGASIRDGQGFSIFDGRNTIRFEFDETSLGPVAGAGDGVTVAGAIPIAYSTTDSAADIAVAVASALNAGIVGSVIDLSATLSSGATSGLTGDNRLNINGDVQINDDDDVLLAIDRSARRGDINRQRSEGVLIVEQNRLTSNLRYGVEIAAGETATVAEVETDSVVRYNRNLVELNTENLNPGLILQNNVLAYNQAGGLRIEGINNVGETITSPATLDTIINNTIVGGAINEAMTAPPEFFDGVLFPQGTISFADAVVDYEPRFSEAPPAQAFQDASTALGPPDGGGIGSEPETGDTAVSLGTAGSLTVQFTNNLLTGSGDSAPDLAIFEIGSIESVRVEVSADGINFTDVGTVGGLVNTIDIDAFGFGVQSRLSFVRVTDLRQGNDEAPSIGADIDAIGAISSVAADLFVSSGIGIDLTGNATPTILNNVLANNAVALSGGDNVAPFLGGNSYYRNATLIDGNIRTGQFAQRIAQSEVLFVDPANLVFTPAFGAPIIDSSLNSLDERDSLAVVRSSIGLASTPTLAPDFDNNGILRIDDPFVEPPQGFGNEVFKDRGSTDRGDTIGPRALLLSPQATSIGLESGSVVVSQAPQFFEIQFIDGLAPADITPGSGIADTSILAGSVVLTRDGVPLVEGVDYRFGYNPTDNVIRLTPVAGVFREDSVYQIRLIDGFDAVIRGAAGATIDDGSLVTLRTASNDLVRLEYETGVTVTLPSNLDVTGASDGLILEIFDGNRTVNFEIDTDDDFDDGNVVVDVPAAANRDTIAAALAAAINNQATTLGGFAVTATAGGNNLNLQSVNLFAEVSSDDAAFTIEGDFGTSFGFGLQIPTEDGLIADSLGDGDTFTIQRGDGEPVLFEFDTNGILTQDDSVAVTLPGSRNVNVLANNLVSAINGAGLGLSPTDVGFGRVALGGNASYTVNVDDSPLILNDSPGQIATVPIRVGVNDTPQQVAAAIAAAINASGNPALSNANTTIINDQVFIDGVAQVVGVGAVETVTVRDRVGNSLQGNTQRGTTELTIFVGGGFDFGDAPGDYITLREDRATTFGPIVQGPRHSIVEGWSLGPSVSAEADARVPNLDDDNGIRIDLLQNGFTATVGINVQVPPSVVDSGSPFYVDAWFDWNANGRFENTEVSRFRSDVMVPDPVNPGAVIPQLRVGDNTVRVSVPSDAAIGNSYARFRLSDNPTLGSTGDASVGEVEDYPIVVNVNAFQNRGGQFDVNGNGFVTPLDALLIINTLRRNQNNPGSGAFIDLDNGSRPANLPAFPDVNGDGRISPLDALLVINELRRQQGSAESVVAQAESVTDAAAMQSTFAPVASGVLASASTIVGDVLIDEAAAVTASAPTSKISVFDSPASVAAERTVDVLADDVAAPAEDNVYAAVDSIFANL